MTSALAGRTLLTVDIDVALVPTETRRWPPRVCIVIDELRASSTLTALIDLGCPEILVTRGLDEARRFGRQRGALLSGERRGLTPRGFDCNNSPTELSRLDLRGRPVVLSTSNGTRTMDLVRRMPATLIGCLNNAGACADAALELAAALRVGIGVVCAGTGGRFALDDAVAAGEIVGRMLRRARATGLEPRVMDAAMAALAIRRAHPDLTEALEASTAGHLVRRIGAAEDIAWCARLDATTAVPVLDPGPPMRVERLDAAALATRGAAPM